MRGSSPASPPSPLGSRAGQAAPGPPRQRKEKWKLSAAPSRSPRPLGPASPSPFPSLLCSLPACPRVPVPVTHLSAGAGRSGRARHRALPHVAPPMASWKERCKYQVNGGASEKMTPGGRVDAGWGPGRRPGRRGCPRRGRKPAETCETTQQKGKLYRATHVPAGGSWGGSEGGWAGGREELEGGTDGRDRGRAEWGRE